MFVRGAVQATRANAYVAEEQMALLFLALVNCFETSIVVTSKVKQL